jgi:protein gp37
MAEFGIPTNAWMGTTVDLQVRVASAEAAFEKVNAGVRWLSVEPMLEPLKFNHLERFDWIVIGGASRSSKTPEWKPPAEWIHDLENQARQAGCKIYEKTNLRGRRILELPFAAPIPSDNVRAPEQFNYLNKSVEGDSC